MVGEETDGGLGVGQRLGRIETMLEDFIKTSKDEIREARHLARNALHAADLQKEINRSVRSDVDRIDRRYDQDIKPLLQHLTQKEAADEGEDTYRKWILPVALSALGLGMMAYSALGGAG